MIKRLIGSTDKPLERIKHLGLAAVGALVIIYILDVWILTSILSLIILPEQAGYFLFHPFQTAGKYFAALFGYRLNNPGLFAAWKITNLLALLLAIAVYVTRYIKRSSFLQAEPGTAGWLTPNETTTVFGSDYVPGIIFGTYESKPLILPTSAYDNRNVAVVGPPGSLKSRAYVRNNMFHAITSDWSVIVTDPKGELARDFLAFYQDKGYVTKVFNLVDMIHSDRWNPLSEVASDIDAQMFCEVVIANTSVPGHKGGDPFWDRAETNLLKALVLYVTMELPPEERNMGKLYDILASGDSKAIEAIFDTLPYNHPAKPPFNIYKETGPQVRSGVIIGLGTRLQVFQNSLVKNLTATSDITLDLPGQRKCAYFCIISDMDHTFSFLASLFFSFLFINLTRYADRNKGELPVATNFLLDEFCNIGHIPDFPKKISTMRSRGIACSVIFQSIVQMKGFYPLFEWETILADCDSWLILGVKDVSTAKYLSDHLGITTIQTTTHRRPVMGFFELGDKTVQLRERNLINPDELTRMPKKQAILSACGLKPLKLEKMDYLNHPMAKELLPKPIDEYQPLWSRSTSIEQKTETKAEKTAQTKTEAATDTQASQSKQGFLTNEPLKQDPFWG